VKRAVHTFAVGDKVKLTGKFLRSTGQLTGSEGLSQWTIIALRDEFAVVDQPVGFDCWTPEEHAADPLLKWRRIHTGNLYRVGTLSGRNCP
jgi:hypothetical protein